MPLWIPYPGTAGLAGPTGLVLPPAGNSGTAVATGTNGAKGSWVSIISSGLSRPACGIWARIILVASSGQLGKATCDIGIDYAGGTSFSVLVPDWLVGSAGDGITTGHWAYFPLHIPAGATLGARVAHIRSTAVTTRVLIVPSAFPLYPWSTYPGQYATTFGVSGVDGTTVTPGNSVWGSWVQIGGATSRPYRWWILGHQSGTATMSTTSKVHEVAFGTSTDKTTLGYIEWEDSTQEYSIHKPHYTSRTGFIPANTNLYVRGQANNNGDTTGQVALTLIG